MKKTLLKIVVLLAVFLGSIAVFVPLLNNETTTRTEDMSEATLPLVYMVYKDVQMNPLHGYVEQMNVPAVRDTLTPISTERDISIKVQTFGADVSDIYFEVFTADGKTSLENTKVTDISRKDDEISAQFTLQNMIRMNQEYVLQLHLKSDGRDVYYYTRVVQQDSLHTKEYLDFVLSFSDKCVNKSGVDILALYMEPDDNVEEVNLSYMDIHTTTNQLVWGHLNPQIYYKSIPVIKELNETTATITQEYLISAQSDEGNVELYTVDEYFRLRYADEAVMLLDFERTTNEIFNPDNNVMTGNGINLGITDKNISFTTDPENNYFAFVQGSELWTYGINNGKMAQVYTFRQKEGSDYRDIYGQHKIKILNLNSSGDMFFVVAGYMNRGRHEGESGVALYHYDASSGGIEENLFVNTSCSYDRLKADVEELTYITDRQSDYYMLLDGDVYQINLATRETKKVVENLKPNCYAGSVSGKKFAYLRENEAYDSSAIEIMDMDTRNVTEITCGENERLRMIGYLDESLVYGIANVDEINAYYEGDEFFPMKEIVILNADNEPVKTYSESGVYILSGEINERLLTMKRIKKNGNDWVWTSDDHIIDNNNQEGTVGMTTQVTDRKQTEMVLLLGDEAPSTPQVVRSRLIVRDSIHEVSIPAKEHEEDLFYVYSKGHLDRSFVNANTAIVYADSTYGIVVDKNQNYIWERGNKKDAAEIPFDSIPQIILSGMMDIYELSNALPDKRVLNLAGCNMDEILYFISAGNPIIADTVDGIRILTGYDQWGNIRFYEPGADETYLLSDEDSLELFEKSDNVFIGFLDKPKE